VESDVSNPLKRTPAKREKKDVINMPFKDIISSADDHCGETVRVLGHESPGKKWIADGS